MRIFITTLLLVGTGRLVSNAGDNSSPPISNLNVMRGIAEEIGFKAGGALPEGRRDTLWAVVRPKENAWYIESSLVQGISKHDCKVLAGAAGALTADFGIAELYVRYSDARSDGVLGKTIIDREVMVTVSARIVDQRTGEIVLDKDISGTRRDTVDLSDIGLLENPNIAVTRGELPSEGFFSSLAGPLIVLAALGIAVYLLFHVRS